jgi:murein DD-endopeptidase MepM/ murein hydrolase activator NlpD
MVHLKGIVQLIVIPENGARTYTFRVRRSIIYMIVTALVLLAVLFGYMVVFHQALLSKAIRAGRLERENDILRNQAMKIAELEEELVRLSAARQHLYEIAGLTMEPPGGDGVSPASESILLPLETAAQVSLTSAEDPFSISAALDTAGAERSSIPTLWPVRGWITAEFNKGRPGGEGRHLGMDIAASQGTAILAAAKGRVSLSGWDQNLGLVVVVDHMNGLNTLYGHCLKVLVQVGDEVSQGQAIAHLGNTGRSSAPHLHFEIRESGTPVDPRGYLGP